LANLCQFRIADCGFAELAKNEISGNRTLSNRKRSKSKL
jgi:hypothetical protein